jgi:hypothetical protein
MRVDRRRFCLQSGAALALGLRRGSGQTTRPNVAAIDHDRILAAANRALGRSASPLTSLPAPPKPAGAHDFYSSEADPDETPSSAARRTALLVLTEDVPALAAGATLLRVSDPALAKRFCDRAAEQLHAWFVAEATRMTPSLLYGRNSGKLAEGVTPGNPEGVIEAAGLAEVAQAVAFLPLDDSTAEGVEGWFVEYLAWLTTSRLAGLARDRKDHHASSWLLQVASFARLTGNEVVLADCRHRFKAMTIRAQIDATGLFPHELTSTAPYRDSLMNLDLLAGVCVLLATRFENLWEYELQDGPGMRAALARHYPFMQDRNSWPYPADIDGFTSLPGRRPSLLFAAQAFKRREYAALWQRLEQDPGHDSAPEIVHSFPIRQPLLWVYPPSPQSMQSLQE